MVPRHAGRENYTLSVRAMRDGAVDFLTKPFRHDDLLEAIERGLRQDRKNRLPRAIVGERRSRFERLTPREQEICV